MNFQESTFANLSSKKQMDMLKRLLYMFFVPLAAPCIAWKVFQAIKQRCGLEKKPLEGMVVVITGASSGIGASLAKILYRSGCRLILAARRAGELERTKSEIIQSRCYGALHNPVVFPIDLSDLSEVPRKTEQMLQIYGHVDILINNAGVSHRGSVLQTNIDVHQHIMKVNYFGPLALTRRLALAMVERGTGRVVFMSSIQGRVSLPYRSAYTASKHAVQALADSLRAELTDLGIQVTVVSPGYVKTNMSRNALTPTGESYGETDVNTAKGASPDYVAKKTVQAICNGENEVIISPLIPRLAVYLRALWPDFFFWLISKQVHKINQ